MIFVLIPLYIPIIINGINDVINENPIEFLCAAKDPKIRSAPILANKTIESNAPSRSSWSSSQMTSLSRERERESSVSIIYHLIVSIYHHGPLLGR